MRLLRSSALALLIMVNACSGLPKAGPTTAQILDQVENQQKTFDLVEISPEVAATTVPASTEGLSRRFRANPPLPTVGVGDTVAVTIWQTGAMNLTIAPEAGGGLAQGNSTGGGTLPGQIIVPEQIVATDGVVTIPFAGQIRAAGRTVLQIQQTIQQALSERLLRPEVLVTIPRSRSDLVTIAGETIGGLRFPVSARGDRLLDVIAAAGGPKAPPHETEIQLSRRGMTGTVSMDRLFLDPAENVYVWPGDTITLTRSPKTFSVFGATQTNNQLPFNASQLTLAEAIARAGGLSDARADPAGVFLFRFETPDVARAVGSRSSLGSIAGVPVMYHLDLQQIGGYFLARRFAMKNNDIIYVAGASTNDLQKFFTLIGAITFPVLGSAVLAK